MKQLIKSLLPDSVLHKYRDLLNRNGVFCPICKSSFREFGPAGLKERKNAKCHNCGSLERHRLIFLYLREKFNFLDNKNRNLRLLHFAPKKMFYDLFSNKDSMIYTPCDLYPENYRFDGNSEVLKVDITNIPFEDESFDFILCNHVLEHVPDDNLAMQELFRVMTNNGNGIFQVPIDYTRTKTYEDWSITTPEEREKAFGQHDHVRWYGQDYKDRLENVGFDVQEIDYTSKFSSREIFKFGLMSSEKIYHVTK